MCELQPVLEEHCYNLFTKLKIEASQPPAKGTLTLLNKRGHAIGLITPKAGQHLLSTGKLLERDFEDGEKALQCTGSDDEYWAELALDLKNAGLLRYWRDELLDIWRYDGEDIVGKIERGACRVLGIQTTAVHLHATTPDGRIWLSKRSDTKPTCPGLWDTLVGGLEVVGEGAIDALRREAFEEVGLAVDHLKLSILQVAPRVCRQLPEGFQHEILLYQHTFLEEDTPMQNQDGEVSEIRTFTLEEVIKLIDDKQLTMQAALIILHYILIGEFRMYHNTLTDEL